MSGSLIACVAVAIAVVMVVLSMLAGALAPVWAATTFGQVLLGGVSALAGITGGRAAHAKFFAKT